MVRGANLSKTEDSYKLFAEFITCHGISFHVMLCHAVSCPIISYHHTIPYHIISYHIIPYHHIQPLPQNPTSTPALKLCTVTRFKSTSTFTSTVAPDYIPFNSFFCSALTSILLFLILDYSD